MAPSHGDWADGTAVLPGLCLRRAGAEGSKGLTILEAADVAYELGCINAYNLDGGATATICIGEKQVNSYWKQKERSIGDIIYFATLVPSGAEEETHE